jgi:hypothetical protein
VKAWCINHRAKLTGIDVRRFISFGIIKGFVYRVHKYAVSLSAAAQDDGSSIGAPSPDKTATNVLPLYKYLDGAHCLDEICTDVQVSARDVMRKLAGYGDVQTINR